MSHIRFCMPRSSRRRYIIEMPHIRFCMPRSSRRRYIIYKKHVTDYMLFGSVCQYFFCEQTTLFPEPKTRRRTPPFPPKTRTPLCRIIRQRGAFRLICSASFRRRGPCGSRSMRALVGFGSHCVAVERSRRVLTDRVRIHPEHLPDIGQRGNVDRCAAVVR